VLFYVLAFGVVISLILFAMINRTGQSQKQNIKVMLQTRDFYIADAGFNFLKTRITDINHEKGAQAVSDFLANMKSKGWQELKFDGKSMGFYRLDHYKVIPVPLAAELKVQGLDGDPQLAKSTYEAVEGVVRVPSLAKYARYIEGGSSLTYTSGTVVDGEILAAGPIALSGSPVHFTRLVSTGKKIQNSANGLYDFGFREDQKDIPTLNAVHVNSWDNYPAGFSSLNGTFESMAKNGGIFLMGDDPVSKNPSWTGLNQKSACSGSKSGRCDTLFASCFDTLSRTSRSPAVVAGSAVMIDLDKLTLSGGGVSLVVEPVIYDAGADGKPWIKYGTPSRTYRRSYSTFRENAIIYFPGDIYLKGRLRKIPVTIVSGDDIFILGSWLGPVRTEVDASGMPVTLGVVAQDRIYIHESSSRELTVRAAMLAENDEIIYEASVAGDKWEYGYVCNREVFEDNRIPTSEQRESFSTYFAQNFIWDNHRVPHSGFGREPDEECIAVGKCTNKELDDFGFVALSYPRTAGSRWKFTFEGALITRQPGSKGPRDACNLGWDCSSDPKRSSWAYDDNLGVAYPPKFPAPVVDDRTPTQVLGYKRKSLGK
jgi:hypothetical protein